MKQCTTGYVHQIYFAQTPRALREAPLRVGSSISLRGKGAVRGEQYEFPAEESYDLPAPRARFERICKKSVQRKPTIWTRHACGLSPSHFLTAIPVSSSEGATLMAHELVKFSFFLRFSFERICKDFAQRKPTIYCRVAATDSVTPRVRRGGCGHEKTGHSCSET